MQTCLALYTPNKTDSWWQNCGINNVRLTNENLSWICCGQLKKFRFSDQSQEEKQYARFIYIAIAKDIVAADEVSVKVMIVRTMLKVLEVNICPMTLVVKFRRCGDLNTDIN